MAASVWNWGRHSWILILPKECTRLMDALVGLKLQITTLKVVVIPESEPGSTCGFCSVTVCEGSEKPTGSQNGLMFRGTAGSSSSSLACLLEVQTGSFPENRKANLSRKPRLFVSVRIRTEQLRADGFYHRSITDSVLYIKI